MKVLIVGGVAGGASAAARLRRLNEQAEIILFERGEHISYANCGLPYYIGGLIPEEEDLLLQTPEFFQSRFRVEVRIRQEVIAICPAEKRVRVRDCVRGEEYEETFDKLILSPGAKPVIPNIPGKTLPHVYVLRDVKDAVRIREQLKQTKSRKAVVIGGGFIGVEVSENLTHQGIQVTIVDLAPQILAPYDAEMSWFIQHKMEEAGIQFSLGTQPQKIEEQNGSCRVFLQNGQVLESDFVVFAIGVRPESQLADSAGIARNAKGGIAVNALLETSQKDIFAVGDVAEIANPVLSSKYMVPLAGPANRQGRIVAGNVLGRKETYEGALGSSVVKVFDWTAACTGVNERTLQVQKKPYEKIYLQPYDHATYYPDSSQMVLKLLFAPDGKILGVQCVGEKGVDKRVDVIAAVMGMGGTVKDLTRLNLCYAPPYASAKDPVNFAGYVAENVLEGLMQVKHWHDLASMDWEREVLLDVRTEEEFQAGHLEKSVNIPVDELRERIGEIPKDKEIVVYCQVGIRGYLAQRILSQNGYNAFNLSGGYGLLEKIGIIKSGVCKVEG